MKICKTSIASGVNRQRTHTRCYRWQRFVFPTNCRNSKNVVGMNTQDKTKRWNIDVKLMMLPFYGMALTLSNAFEFFFYCCFHMKNVTHFTLTELNTTIILGFTRKKFRSLPLLHIILCGSPQRQSQKFNLFYEPAWISKELWKY